VPHCESHELYKGIIDDQASGAFNGKVYVHQDAQKTNAFQQNDSLVLSANARMNSKPQLEIYADDVKCSHGATIGQMDEKSLFYLMSRGIKKEAAKHMLKSAFLSEVLNTVSIEPLRAHIHSKMSQEL
jgi:Fe-S cluster assembly protein SufD